MILAIVQARLGSNRFPRKVLEDINGKSMIQRVADQVRGIHGANYGVVAIPAGDKITVDGLEVMETKAKPDDVLGRFYEVVQQHPDADTIMRITGDCPLLCPEIADEVIANFKSMRGCHYASNRDIGYIDGTDVEVFSRETLFEAHLRCKQRDDREHVTQWMLGSAHVAVVQARATIDIKLSVDTRADLECVRAVSKLIPGVGSSYYKLSTLREAIEKYKNGQAVKPHKSR